MLRTHLARLILRSRFTLALSLATLCPVPAWICPARVGSEQALGSEFIAQQNAEPIVKPSDRVVLIGGGWVERMHRHPWFEMMMSLEVPSVTFRNMGWSGDTVHGDARAVFGGRADGYQRLIKDSEIAAPNVAILCYGENEAYLNEAERAEFLRGYKKLIEDLKAKGSRIVLVIPRGREDAGPQFPNPAYYNSNLSQVAEGIRSLAKETQSNLIDLEKFAKEQRFTDEGIAWNDAGYRASAQEMMRQLGFNNLELNKLAASKPAAIEELRSKIESKNEWFFHRYRPQNETYLFLFRKHEQGNNAVEVDQMEQFVKDGENKITQWIKDQNIGPRTK
jgi:hypothetical protein